MTSYTSPQSIFSTNTNAGAIEAAVSRQIANLGTNTIVQVKAVRGGGASLVGEVDVQPLVHQQDGQGRTTPHGVITGVPYLRVQGGASAIIIDPQIGDIGYIIVSGRDISNVIKSRKASAPGSFRMHSMSDCVYVGGYLNDAPTQYIIMTGDGVRIVSPYTVKIEAQSAEIACNLKVDGDVEVTGDVTAGNISLKTHTHGGVQKGGGSTDEPQ